MALRMTSCLLLLSCERDKTSEREKPQTSGRTRATPARQTSSSITDSSRERRTKRSEDKRSEQQREVTVPVLLLHQDCTHECYSPSSYAIICHDMSSNVIIYRLVHIVTSQALFTIKGGAPPVYQVTPAK